MGFMTGDRVISLVGQLAVHASGGWNRRVRLLSEISHSHSGMFGKPKDLCCQHQYTVQ